MTICDLVGLNLCAWKLGQNISKEYEGELSAMPSPEQVALLCRYMYLCILKIAFTDINQSSITWILCNTYLFR